MVGATKKRKHTAHRISTPNHMPATHHIPRPCGRPPARRPRLPPAAALPTPPPPPPAPAPLRVVVDAATSALRAVTPAPALTDAGGVTSYTQPDDGVGVASLDDVAATIRADFGNQYFVSSIITGRLYSPTAVFADPTVSITGLAEWRRNILLLKPWLADATIDLEGVEVDDAASTVYAAWSLHAPIPRLPWKPVVDVRGVTTYTVERAGVDGGLVVTRHEEAWRTPAAAAVAQLLRPG